ncbi:bifunctional RNase H/acid phosphatase [Nocardioides pacificus]
MTAGSHEAVIIEADGGSRGNPGPSAYGALLKDARTGTLIAEAAETLGVATNNVAEYSGLIAGLKLAAQFAPGARVEVRMDSKLVVEQMSGRWKIKHPSMQPLAAEARRLAPPGTTYTWIPRAKNSHADRLANEALDGKRDGVSAAGIDPDQGLDDPELSDPETQPARGWAASGDKATTVVLVRHGVTEHTSAKRFSGGLGGDNPGLSDEGRAQARATAEWLAPLVEEIDIIVSSPVRRTLETAEIIAEYLGDDCPRPVEVEPGFAEMEFGSWDGLTFAQIARRHPAELDAWLNSMDVAPGGGESFRTVEQRVLAGLHRLLTRHAGRTVVVVSHVTPIKTLVADALRAPLESVYRMELSPASVTVLSYFLGGREGDESMASMRLYNARPADHPTLR